MMISCHVLTGCAIATKISQPKLAMATALGAHFALDSVPHFGNAPAFGLKGVFFPTVVAIDSFIIAAILTIFCKAAYKSKDKLLAKRFLLCAVASAMPDLLLLLKGVAIPENWWLYQFHSAIQWYQQPIGILIEIIYGVGVAYGLSIMLAQKSKSKTQKATSTAGV